MLFYFFKKMSIAGKFPNPSFRCRKPHKNDPKIHFHTFLTSDTQKWSKNRKHHPIPGSVRNRFWFAPAKSDIATSAPFCTPKKHAFTAKAAWADLARSIWKAHRRLTTVSHCDWQAAVSLPKYRGARPLLLITSTRLRSWVHMATLMYNFCGFRAQRINAAGSWLGQPAGAPAASG